MADYIRVPFEADPATIERRIYDYIQEYFPDFAPRPGHVIVVQTEAFAQAVSELMQMATDVPQDIFITLGLLFGVVATPPIAASTTVTITARDNAGYTIPENMAFRLLIGGDEYAGFETVAPATILNGETVIAGVQAVAIEEGTRSNDLDGEVELIDIHDFILSVELDDPTGGGQDAESVDDFMDRFATRLQLLKDGVVTARDAELYIMSDVQISRAKAIDNYDPDTDDDEAEKTIAWTALDNAGAEISVPKRAEVVAMLAPTREVNFNFKYMSPDFNDVTIVAAFTVHDGFEVEPSEDAVEAALLSYLNPLIFNSTDFHNAPQEWIDKTHLRYLEVATVINNVEPVNEITALTINGVAGDLALTGMIPLISPDPVLTLTASLS